jgi:aromatic-L-amino-acid decarboxylase
MDNHHTSTPSLSPDREEIKRLVEIAMKFVIPHQITPDQSPLNGSGVKWLHFEGMTEERNHANKLAKSIVEPLPEVGQADFETLLNDVFKPLVTYSSNDNSGGYLAYIPSGGLFHAVLADLIALSVNRYVTLFMSAPGLAAIENQVIRWLCDIIGFPKNSRAGGVLSSGGSMATLTAIHAARIDRLSGKDFQKGTIYVNEQAHHCVEQALIICGFPSQNIRKIPTNQYFQMRIEVIEKLIKQDKDNGLEPFLLVATAGTTNTGAIDDLLGSSKLAKKYKMWFHIDAAYGGFFMLTKRGKSLMKGIEQADSLVIDPHKGLFLPHGTGALLVKDQHKLRQAFDLSGSYLPVSKNDTSSNLTEDIMHLSPELTRDFRGFRLWLPLKMLGIRPFRQQLNEKLDLAIWVTQQLQNIPFIKIVASPQLSILAFKLIPIEYKNNSKKLDELNIKLLDKINQQGNILLSPFQNKKQGGFSIRIAILSFRTTKEHLKQGIKDVRQSVLKMIKIS